MLLRTLCISAVNQMLRRTIPTSTVFRFRFCKCACSVVQFLRDFSLAIIVGGVVGTYSSIFIACRLCSGGHVPRGESAASGDHPKAYRRQSASCVNAA